MFSTSGGRFSIQSGAFLNVNCRGDCEIRLCEVELHFNPTITKHWNLRFRFVNPDFDIVVDVILVKPKISFFKREDFDVFSSNWHAAKLLHMELGRIYTSPKIIQDLVENMPMNGMEYNGNDFGVESGKNRTKWILDRLDPSGSCSAKASHNFQKFLG